MFKTAISALVVTAIVALTACVPNSSGATTKAHATTSAPAKTPAAKANTSSSDVEFEAECDTNNHAIHVKPNTRKARAAAEKTCQKMGKAIDDAPWPNGVHPVPLPHH